MCGGAVVSWLVHSTPDQVVQVQALACDGLASHPEGSSNTPSHFMLMKPESSTGPMGQLGLYKGFTFFFPFVQRLDNGIHLNIFLLSG